MRWVNAAVAVLALVSVAASCSTQTLVCTENETQCIWACTSYCYGAGCAASCGPVCGDTCIERRYAWVKGLCEPCVTSLECQDGACLWSEEDGRGRCARACGDGGSCPTGFACATVSPRLPPQCIPSAISCGEQIPCAKDLDCGPGAVCRGQRCVARPGMAGDAGTDASADAGTGADAGADADAEAGADAS